jgi:hypothetical protein
MAGCVHSGAGQEGLQGGRAFQRGQMHERMRHGAREHPPVLLPTPTWHQHSPGCKGGVGALPRDHLVGP